MTTYERLLTCLLLVMCKNIVSARTKLFMYINKFTFHFLLYYCYRILIITSIFFFFFLSDPAPTEISTLPLPDALPIWQRPEPLDEPGLHVPLQDRRQHEQPPDAEDDAGHGREQLDRDSDRALEPHRRQLGEKDREIGRAHV